MDVIAPVAVIASVVLAAVIAWSAWILVREIRSLGEETRRARTLTIMELFRPALDPAQGDPRALLVWQPLARAARALFPREFAELDRANGSPFPFGPDTVQAAHAQWTADWLTWERTHDAEYKRKAAAAEHELSTSDGSTASLARATLDAIEREKLELYQRRYAEYVRVARALQALASPVAST